MTGNVVIDSAYTSTNLAVNPVSGYYNNLVSLTVTLKDAGNNPVSGKTVNFIVNGSSVGNA